MEHLTPLGEVGGGLQKWYTFFFIYTFYLPFFSPHSFLALQSRGLGYYRSGICGGGGGELIGLC